MKKSLVYTIVIVALCGVCFATNNDWTIFHSTEGIVNEALNFDGVGDYIDLPTLEAAIEGQSLGSIATWIKMAEIDVGYVFFSHSALAVHDLYITLGITDANEFTMTFRNDTGTRGEEFLGFTGNTVLEIDTWHFVVLTSDGSTYKMYVDGSEETLTGTGDSVNNGNWFADINNADYSDFIGKHEDSGGATDFFNGDIDNVMIFDFELSQGDVSWLYNGGSGRDSLSSPNASYRQIRKEYTGRGRLRYGQ